MSERKITIEDVMAALFRPVPEFNVIPEKSVLLLINFLDYTDFFVKTAVKKFMPEPEVSETLSDFGLRAKKAASNASKILKACREKGFEVVHVLPEAKGEKTEPVANAEWKTGLVIASEEEVLAIYEEVKPRKGELVFSKANGEAFTGTRLHYVLQNMYVDTLIVCGLMTDQSVLSSTIHAVDLGYNVILVEDACTTLAQETHETFIKWYRTFVNVKTAEEVLNLIQKK